MPHFIEEDIPQRAEKEVGIKMNVAKEPMIVEGENDDSTDRHWIMGKEAFERRMPHHDGIEALWETKWKFPCSKGLYPFHDGKYEDFEPIFAHLIENNINDGTSIDYTQSFLPTAHRLIALADAAASTADALTNSPAHDHHSTLANDLYLRACAVLRISRFPYVFSHPSLPAGITCPVKYAAHTLQKQTYLRAASRWKEPISEVQIPHIHRAVQSSDGSAIPAYVRLPASTAEEGTPAPVVILFTGLDGYRPDNTVRTEEIVVKRGWACVIVEIPGTADCPADPSDPLAADRLCDSLLDWMEAVGVFDMSRVVVWGLSCGGYYAIRSAHVQRKRLRGVVAQGAGCHLWFGKEWLERADGHEYPFELTEALAVKFGYQSVEEFREGAMEKWSLVETGVVNGESTRLLLVNGILDGLMPIEDSMLLFEHGSPKEARFFPGALHMGYPLANHSVYPWLESLMATGDNSVSEVGME